MFLISHMTSRKIGTNVADDKTKDKRSHGDKT
jgi:hypothetical protein